MAAEIDTSSECNKLHPWTGASPQTEQGYYQQFDSLRKYIELCASEQLSFHAFPKIITDCQYTNTSDTTRYDRVREWCKSVLYLNTTEPDYFCADLGTIADTYLYGQWKIPNAALAIFEYLAQNPNCNSEGLQQVIKDNIRSRHDTYLTYKQFDSNAVEDTILPTMKQLGLDSLLALHGSASVPFSLPPTYLSSFTSIPNPFIDETNLRFTLNRLAYLTIAIYDELGRPVWGDGSGRTFEVGEHEISIDGKSLLIGSFYARIATGFGEVKTVKLVHVK